MPKIYKYVGPEDLLAKGLKAPTGTRITSAADLAAWCTHREEDVTPHGLVPLTYVIDPEGHLLVAPRRSEHVSCAGGSGVRTAGEMFVLLVDGHAEVVEVTNQSTGYCPEPSSWPEVEASLDRAGIPHPGGFTSEVVFRHCPSCGMRNIVKDGWLVCDNCQAELPADYNLRGHA